MSLNEFLHMGGYGVYVWSAYGICFVALVLNVLLPILNERKILQRLQDRLYEQTDN
jgi:heme exporter protein D